MGMTMAEKVLARASGKASVSPGEFVTAKIDVLMGHDFTFFWALDALIKSGYSNVKVWDPDKIVIVFDHFVPAPSVEHAEHQLRLRNFVKEQGIKNFFDVGVGICHQVIPEKGLALPGHLIVGGDSHTTTYGALGTASTGIGISEMAYVMVKGSLWFMVPETIRFRLTGSLPKGTSAKDIILKIAGQYKVEIAQYQSVEFTGPTAKAMSVDQRMTISNMGVEIGGKFAFFETDEKTAAYLKERTNQVIKPFGPDPDAHYAATYEIDVSALEPQVACPHNVDNVKPVSEIGDIPVQQALLISCTDAKIEDLERAAAILKGKKVHPGTRLLVYPASLEIFTHLVKSGAIQTFVEAGALIGPPNCGPCGGSNMGVLASGETAISSTNRNFKGRMGSLEGFVYLASTETVAASAIEGKITDPRKYLA